MFKLIKFLAVLFLGVISCACVNMVAVHELNVKASNYLEEGDIDSAISRLEASVDLDGNIYESRYNLASAYLQIGKANKALENIRVASELNKTEPIVFYTHGVIATQVANELYETKDDNGLAKPVVYQTNEQARKAANLYVELLKEANENFEKYTQLVPNAEDTQQIYIIIKENQEKISQKMLELNIE